VIFRMQATCAGKSGDNIRRRANKKARLRRRRRRLGMATQADAQLTEVPDAAAGALSDFSNSDCAAACLNDLGCLAYDSQGSSSGAEGKACMLSHACDHSMKGEAGWVQKTWAVSVAFDATAATAATGKMVMKKRKKKSKHQ